MNEKQQERARIQERCHREELIERLAQAIPTDGKSEPFKGLYLARASALTESTHVVTQPSFCVIAQGRKEIYLGEELYEYDPHSYLLTTVELPMVGRVLQASEEEPYLSLRLVLDPALVGSVMMEVAQPTTRGQSDAKALTVSRLDSTLLESVVRLVRLLSAQQSSSSNEGSRSEARLLLPLITREIVYRLLTGEQGGRLRQMTVLGGHTYLIAQAVERIRAEFHQPLRIEDLARQVGMSVSGFHHHFKAVTAMSPLQFQKQLRLQEARRLLLGSDVDAASAGHRVGYDDVSQFHREYKRLFGVPPLQDVERLREVAGVGASF